MISFIFKTACLALTSTTVTALERRDFLAHFEDLDTAENDVYAARPIGTYGGLNFGSQLGETL